MTAGSCLCGTVRWETRGPFRHMTHCHCSMCRKAHGAPFATYLDIAVEAFDWVSGEQAIVHYASSPGLFRSFCGNCGSVVPIVDDGGDVDVPAGCLDDDPGIRPSAHIFAASKAPWHDIVSDLPQYPTWNREAPWPAVEDATRSEPTPGVVRGSCLCGGVAFEVTTPFEVAYNCHCGRCRKARAAAHTTNGFTPPTGVNYTRGEELLKRHKVPEAKVFSQTFCSVCGSGLPRLNSPQELVAVPFGALDDDPGMVAGCHIFTAYKADWYAIEDSLPQFAEESE